MYTMVLMMAVGGSADATAFGGRKASCTGGGYTAGSGCTGYGSYLPAYTGCTGAVATGSCTGSCTGSKKGGFLGGLFHHNKKSCHGGAYTGCTGTVAAAAPSCGCCGSSYTATAMVSSPVFAGPVMTTGCMTPGMAPLTVTPAMAAPAAMPSTLDKMPAPTPAPAPAPAPEKPAGGTKI